jgi:bifunctional DNase/RNase
MLVRIEFVSFAASGEGNSPVVVLKEITGTRLLMLPVGPLEGSVIAMETLGMNPRKPAAIHVAHRIMEKLGGTLTRAVLYLTTGQTLMARLEIASRGTAARIDCRPFDAVVLALRCEAPLLARESVFGQFCRSGGSPKGDTLRAHIAAIDTLDFGSYFLE